MGPRPLYTLFCCDCCLAHQLHFRIVMSPKGKRCIQYRIRRADMYTQMMRKKTRSITKLNKGEKIKALHDGVMVAVLPNGLRRGKRKKRKA